MCIDGHVTRCPAQTLALPVWNMLLCLWVAVLFGHAEINDPDCVGAFGARSTNEEIVRFDISVDEVLFMYCLYASELFVQAFVVRNDNVPPKTFNEPSVSQS